MGARGRNPLSIGVIIRRRTGRLNHRRFPQFSRRLRCASLHSANEKIGSPVARFAAASRWLTRPARHRARLHLSPDEEQDDVDRSEERRVGKEWGRTCRSRWSRYHLKKKTKKIIISNRIRKSRKQI